MFTVMLGVWGTLNWNNTCLHWHLVFLCTKYVRITLFWDIVFSGQQNYARLSSGLNLLGAKTLFDYLEV